MKQIILILFAWAACTLAVHAQKYTAQCDSVFENPALVWTLQKVEYFDDATRCHFSVKSKIDGVTLGIKPGSYMTDVKEHKYKYTGCSSNMEQPHKFGDADNTVNFYLEYEPMQEYAWEASLVLPGLKTISDIRVGDGKTITHEFTGSHRPKAQRANLWITKIVRTDDKTVVEFLYDNVKKGIPGYYDWARINAGSVLRVDGKDYRMFLGEEKGFSFRERQTKSFTCAFTRIPKDAKTFAFIETPSSSFNITGVNLPISMEP